MNLWNYGKMKNKTTNIIVSSCLYCALLTEYLNEEYYRCITSILFMDNLIHELKERFIRKTKSVMSGIYVIPSLIDKLLESEIFEYYQSDLPSESSFCHKIQLWKRN